MTWDIEIFPKEDNHPDLDERIQVYALIANEEFALAEYDHDEEKNIAVFHLHFPLDDEDVQEALKIFRNFKQVPVVYCLDEGTAEDTGLPILHYGVDSILTHFFEEYYLES